MTTSGTAIELPAPLMLGDHPALDLLNTRMTVEGRRQDLLTDEASAFRWLEQAGFGMGERHDEPGNGRVLDELRRLRDSIEHLVHARLENRSADPAALNAFLLNAVPQLVWAADKTPVLDRFCQPEAVGRALGEIALAAAQLLAEGDLARVRKCESHECSLMFYDRTKAHKRRWCSMALCGNRHKVAEFRRRRQEAGS